MHPRVHVLASATRGTQPDGARPRRSARSGCLGSRAASAPTGAAAPTVSVRGRAVPIRRFPHTGNYFGAAPAVHAEVRISGTETRRVPSTLINVCLPKGVRLHPQSFPTCPPRVVIEEREVRKCPKGSALGPPWKAAGVVAFGSTRVPEEVEIFSFYAPGGGFEFLTPAENPCCSKSRRRVTCCTRPAAGGFRPEFSGTVPLVETVPVRPTPSSNRSTSRSGPPSGGRGHVLYYGRVRRRVRGAGSREG